MNSGYAKLLQSIQRIISQEGFDGSDPQVLNTLTLLFNPVIILLLLFLHKVLDKLLRNKLFLNIGKVNKWNK